MNLAAVVILYYPEEDVIDNILSYAKHVQKVYVMDNTEKPKWNIKDKTGRIENIAYFADGVNEGIAKRLNNAIDFALQDGFTHLLTMDQDSAFNDNLFTQYIAGIKAYPSPEEVGMFAINYQPDITVNTGKAEEVISSITSGSIVNVKAVAEAGKYNEDLFIDLVDADICYRLYNKGKKIICFTYIVMQHRLGNIVYGRSLKSFKLTPRIIHSPIRIYYIVRNVLHMLKHFPDLPPGAKAELKSTLWLLKNNILYHPERLKVIRYAVKGYSDYKKSRMGKLAI